MEKIKRHFVYHGKANGLETNVYYVINKKTQKKEYYVLHEFANTQENKDNAQKAINQFNEYHRRKADMLFRLDKDGVEHSYINEPCFAFEALMAMVDTEKAAKKEGNQNGSKEPKGLVIEENYKLPSVEFRRKIAGLLAGVTLFGVSIGLSMGFINPEVTINETPAAQIAESYSGETTIAPNFYGSSETTITPDMIFEPETTTESETTQEEENQRVYIDYDSLKFSTHKDSAGTDYIELADALKIANACYNNIVIELEAYNDKSLDDYSFDAEKFVASMFVGNQIRESSLKVYVGKDGNIKIAVDYNDQCRGPFKIGPDGIAEANEVSKKLTGELVIRDEKDLYDMVRACRACMYIAIKNYEYCADIIGDAVEPRMVFDTYLYGCGNVRSWLRDCLENGEYNGEYNQKNYSKDILYYYEVVEDYWQKLLSGITDGSHDKVWQNTYYNGLWKKPDWSKQVETTQNAEPGQ